MVLLFYGPNSYELRRKLREMVEQYKTKTGSDLGLERLDGKNLKLETLKASLQAMPFLVSSRLVLVEGAGANKSLAAEIPAMVVNVPETTVAVFVEPDLDQRTSYAKDMIAATKPAKFELLGRSQLEAWVMRQVQVAGGTIDRAAARELVELTGEDQWRLEGEVGKLVNYEPVVTLETVRALVVPSVQQNIFDLVEAMVAGRVDRALAVYRGLLAERQSELYVLTMIQWQLRALLLAASADGMKPGELAKASGLSPYVLEKAMRNVRNLDIADLRQAFAAAVDLEADIKTGRVRGEAGVEALLYQLASSRRPA